MATIYPFRALRPTPGKEGAVASVPYDVVTRDEARKIGDMNAESFIHVLRPEIDLPDLVDEHFPEVYVAASKALSRFIDDRLLAEDKSSGLYVYALEASGSTQYGVVACCDVAEYESNVILKHELTRPDKEDDRVRHMESLACHTGPVLMTYRRNPRISEIVDRAVASEPYFSFLSEDGVRHSGWKIEDPGSLVEAFSEVTSFYIADGHHRTAAAARVATTRSAMSETAIGNNHDCDPDEAGRFLSVLFPNDELRILSYNRHFSLDREGVARIEAELRKNFKIAECTHGHPDRRGTVCFYTGEVWRSLELPSTQDTTASPVAALDLAIFGREVLEPIIGVTDQRTDSRITFVGGQDSVDTLEQRVDNHGGIAFSFFPVSVNELIAVSDADELMPPKSTWFSPKLRSGLYSHRFSP
jgi:uncharacterized protein (DUF1015 family)